jgi:hypothetical protein
MLWGLVPGDCILVAVARTNTLGQGRRRYRRSHEEIIPRRSRKWEAALDNEVASAVAAVPIGCVVCTRAALTDLVWEVSIPDTNESCKTWLPLDSPEVEMGWACHTYW